jgi:succinate dehydrogenase/fumarate reductase cytochrome b subunit (b558 family)
MVLERTFSPGLSSAGKAMRWRRLHALAGAVPLGAFLLLHLVGQSAALGGRDGFVRSASSPVSAASIALEVALVYLPLAFHAGYGLLACVGLAPARRQSIRAARRPLERRTLQLATGIVVGVFLLVHLWQFRVRLWVGELEPSDFFDELCASLSSTAFGGVPLTALGYLIALGAVAFHFSSGLHGAVRTWGIVLSERAARVTTGLFVALGVVLFVLGAITVIYLATGSVSLPSAG